MCVRECVVYNIAMGGLGEECAGVGVFRVGFRVFSPKHAGSIGGVIFLDPFR